MRHFTSGKDGFDYYASDHLIPKEYLIPIMRREDELRASPEYQAKYTEKDELQWFRDVTLEIQTKAIEESNYLNYLVNQNVAVYPDKETALKFALQGLWGTRAICRRSRCKSINHLST